MKPEDKEQVSKLLYAAFAAKHMLEKDKVREYLRALVCLFGAEDILKT